MGSGLNGVTLMGSGLVSFLVRHLDDFADPRVVQLKIVCDLFLAITTAAIRCLNRFVARFVLARIVRQRLRYWALVQGGNVLQRLINA